MNLSSSLMISGIIHLCLLLLLPGFSVSRLALTKPYIEVSLLPPSRLVKKYTPPAPPKRKKTKPGKWQALAPQLSGGKRSLRSRSYQPAVELPSAASKREVAGFIPEQAFSLDELLEALPIPQPLAQPSRQPIAEQPKPSSQPTAAEISWSGPPRRYLYKPADPSYSSRKRLEGEVRLKFWVDPQGNVTNVVVLRKLDAQLERLAIDYMKRWRFEPLKEEKRQLQWGTINIKFRQE
jgi:TonB family protein